jgi:hypothetical protein
MLDPDVDRTEMQRPDASRKIRPASSSIACGVVSTSVMVDIAFASLCGTVPLT